MELGGPGMRIAGQNTTSCELRYRELGSETGEKEGVRMSNVRPDPKISEAIAMCHEGQTRLIFLIE